MNGQAEIVRELTSEERERLRKVREGFEGLVSEVPRFIGELAEIVGASGAKTDTQEESSRLLARVDRMLRSAACDGLDEPLRDWLGVRLAFFAGNCLVKFNEGRWAIQEDPDAKAFGMVVVENCLLSSDPELQLFVDVGQVGINAVLQRSLQAEMLKLPVKGARNWFVAEQT